MSNVELKKLIDWCDNYEEFYLSEDLGWSCEYVQGFGDALYEMKAKLEEIINQSN